MLGMIRKTKKAINPAIFTTAREGRQLSQYRLAKLTDMTRAAISLLEKQEMDPRFSTFAKIVRELGLEHVPVGEFFDPKFFDESV
jgi:transcriptional regulator with XRE-family HTH domain